MSAPSEPAAIPARVAVADLARALEIEISTLQAALMMNHEPSGPDDILDAVASRAAAAALGLEVRVEARDMALEILYEIDSRHEFEVPDDIPARVDRLVHGVVETREGLDHEIEAASKHWAIARMPMIDRAILRLGLWELKNDQEIPTAVIISEAVRLANTYSTTRSGSFVNGVLGALAKAVR